ncbi:hypothetical protein KTO58_08535 [Chitinophaga pendula]|uniref:hypothetical protein n=1 Tax=Chitinophaga TaxID=79328 RepID=UPI000BAF0038|nr:MULTISPECIES: hypothetical protein [Chitinophaga]ASZ13159.1 hypothetical protein CK934_20440 [Chitinophaga sp. MD30]UCJ09216.1 hypothetical protein KTO58_08535 [Chitinophaga pendula]
MAKQPRAFPFTGRCGNLIGYRRNGHYFLRTRPDTVRQTPATRRAAKEFGIASSKGKLIRRALSSHLDTRYDGTLINRLNKILITAGKNLSPLTGFRFNKQAGTERYLHLSLTANNSEVCLTPHTTALLEIKLIATRICFATGKVITSRALITAMAGQSIRMDATLPGKGTLILTLQVHALSHGNHNKNIVADIIAIQPPAPPSPKKRFKHPKKMSPALFITWPRQLPEMPAFRHYKPPLHE